MNECYVVNEGDNLFGQKCLLIVHVVIPLINTLKCMCNTSYRVDFCSTLVSDQDTNTYIFTAGGTGDSCYTFY